MEVYPLVYSFLKNNGHIDAAKVFRQSANIKKKDLLTDEDLLQIYMDFKQRENSQNQKRSKANTNKSNETCVTEDHDDKLEVNVIVKKKTKNKKANETSKVVDVKSTEKEKISTVELKQKNTKPSKESKVLSKPNLPPPVKKVEVLLESESDDDNEVEDSDSSDDDDEEEENSDSDSDDDEESVADRLQLIEEARKKKAVEASKASEEWMKRASTGSTGSTANSTKSIKKRKLSEGGLTPGSEDRRTSGEAAFRRVDAEEWNKEIIIGLEDNSYEKAFGSDGYGAKASAKLMTVRGKDFRHEKTKKKRGSYRGGEITMASNSFKYDD